MEDKTPFSVAHSHALIQSTLSRHHTNALPSPSAALCAAATLHASLQPAGLGDFQTLAHLLEDIVPGFNGPKTSANYYGFVTGGVLPIAEAADSIVTAWDQNVQVHLPEQSVATVVEARALEMLVQLLRLEDSGKEWKGRTFTTGATSSNVLGLACGRDEVLRKRWLDRKLKDEDDGSVTTAELGLLESCKRAGVEEFQILTTMGHSSLPKAASIVGLGRKCVIDVGHPDTPWKFDMQKLETLLKKEKTASIVVISCGEVNAGRFATSNFEEMSRIKELCGLYGAWLHVDGAFGLFARVLPEGEEFSLLHQACEGMELADSITGDAHKGLNVPYDCGFFLTSHPHIQTSIFRNPNAAYLSSSATSEPTIPSPLHIGIENSRRFRALPIYAVLVSHGRSGLASLFARQVRLARLIAAFVAGHPGYELLPHGPATTTYASTGIVVLFRAVDEGVNRDLAARINRSCRIMVSGTAWEGRPAVRIAVSTWKVDEQRDLAVVREVLEGALLD